MEILTDALHRIAYATDASAYREMPMGVAYPKDEQDIRELLNEARKRHTHLIPRAAGTSIAGQVVGKGIVVDISRFMNHILEINPEQHWVRVQPGVVRDDLNIALRPYGLFFSPETSTSNRCCIGGMVGNNSCGTHSLIYGSTRPHVLALKGLLASGEPFDTEQPSTTFLRSPLGQSIYAQLTAWQQDPHIRQLLTTHFPDPSLTRRSCGYALDECLFPQPADSPSLNLPALITGSEGTLCFITEIKLHLDPLPPAHKFVVCRMLDHLNDAWQANLDALAQHPGAVELIDGKILELAKGNPSAEKNMEVLGLDKEHLPAGILVSEFWAETNDELQQKASEYVRKRSITGAQGVIRPSVDRRQNHGETSVQILFDSDVDQVWALRKAGLGVLTSGDKPAKPVGVIEDTAVAPERLGAYMADFQAMMASLHLDCVYYGHISTGELHLRPILDLHQPADRQLFRQVAEQTALLVKKHRGSLSGEHGDGRLRGEFIPLMYGNEVYELFRQLKRTWDPESLLNMGKIVDTPPMDESLRFPLSPLNSKLSPLNSKLSPLNSQLNSQLERCNGSGDCRKSNLIGGTMCPTYKVSGEEIMTTRARANVLREKLTTDPNGVTSDEVKTVLDSCLACKGCHSECPSNVDMTRLRSEILQLYYDRKGTPFRTWMVARMAMVERLGSLVPRLYNWFASTPFTRILIQHILRFSTERHIPTLSRHSMRWLIAHDSRLHTPSAQRSILHTPSSKGKIYLFADEFTNHEEAELGLHFAQLVRALGYEVEVPRHVESGRAALSKGCLRLAARYARKNIQLLSPVISDETPLVGIEPSCILSFRDEYPRLVGGSSCTIYDEELKIKSEQLAKNCLLYDEWLMREVERGHLSAADFAPLSPLNSKLPPLNSPTIYLHGHCHQKALVGVEKTAECLRLIGATVHVIPSGCCGMAGSFGYEKEHYATSMAIGEMVLFPAIRQITAPLVAAPGTSCRHQILDGTGIQAYHPIEILYQHIYGNK